VLVREGAGSLMVWETVARNYFFNFSLLSNLGFLIAVLNFTDGFMHPSNSEIKQEMNVITIITYLSYVALKWCMTSPSHINRLFVSTLLFSGLDFI